MEISEALVSSVERIIPIPTIAIKVYNATNPGAITLGTWHWVGQTRPPGFHVALRQSEFRSEKTEETANSLA